MNYNSNSSFATVVFVFVVLILMGGLMYHCKVISADNQQLTEANGTLQARVDALTTANTDLQTEKEVLISENTTLRVENDSLVAENSRLETELAAALAEVTSLEQETDTTSELDALRLENNVLWQENQRLNSSLGDHSETSRSIPEVLQSTLLPCDQEVLVNILITLVIGGCLVLTYILYRIAREHLLKKTSFANDVDHTKSGSRKNSHPYILDSHYYDQ